MKTMYAGGRLFVKDTVIYRFSDREYYVDVPEKKFNDSAVEVTPFVFEMRIGKRGSIRLLYNTNKGMSLPELPMQKVDNMYYTEGEIERINNGGNKQFQ